AGAGRPARPAAHAGAARPALSARAALGSLRRRGGGQRCALAGLYLARGRHAGLLAGRRGGAFAALSTSPGARAYYHKQRARGAGHNPALRQVANRLVGILHGCLKTGTPYDETTAWPHHTQNLAA